MLFHNATSDSTIFKNLSSAHQRSIFDEYIELGLDPSNIDLFKGNYFNTIIQTSMDTSMISTRSGGRRKSNVATPRRSPMALKR